jgi:hypothetical protein
MMNFILMPPSQTFVNGVGLIFLSVIMLLVALTLLSFKKSKQSLYFFAAFICSSLIGFYLIND